MDKEFKDIIETKLNNLIVEYKKTSSEECLVKINLYLNIFKNIITVEKDKVSTELEKQMMGYVNGVDPQMLQSILKQFNI